MFGKYSQGFKLPSFFALGNPIVGNSELQSEESESWEVGFENSLCENKGTISASWFITDFENAIDFDEGPPPSLVNRSNVTSQGVELRASYNPGSNLRAILSAAYVCLLYTSPSPRDATLSRMPSSA